MAGKVLIDQCESRAAIDASDCSLKGQNLKMLICCVFRNVIDWWWAKRTGRNLSSCRKWVFISVFTHLLIQWCVTKQLPYLWLTDPWALFSLVCLCLIGLRGQLWHHPSLLGPSQWAHTQLVENYLFWGFFYYRFFLCEYIFVLYKIVLLETGHASQKLQAVCSISCFYLCQRD